MFDLTEDWKNAGFGIYVHWPFCAAKCPYCDFNSHVRDSVDQKRWADALCRELENEHARTPNRLVNTIFFGGGTPSLMSPDTVRQIIDKISNLWQVDMNTEINLEANPTSVEATKFAGFAQAGVNRLSMGVQALNDADLRRLGRMHSAAEARAAFDIAKKYFTRVSFDLIYARQDQDQNSWHSELREAAEMAVDHLSLYQLTIEPNTRFGELYDRGKLRGLPSDDASADMYARTQDYCNALGMPAYEVSNHAAPGSESRHNLIYWRYGDYVGVGAGAHGRITVDRQRIATHSPENPEKWLSLVEQNGTALYDAERVEPEDQASEYLMMSLRLSEGTNITRYQSLNGSPPRDSAIKNNVDLGLLKREKNRLIATNSGRMVLNAILRDLLA
ncbi:coproporphyrinogen III oxidase [Amylibacter marinus]|uniref:Heme chaperone HemW n=1 Tax=Amylibacter marinus TaxID=1475483 RepID=A0ABQ5VW00_9RHOB|nr:radical SAM family heme chaperone HemW [Amylibacter marinus]GLQ35520.1 coproporphyrinogen III oxidase [Amylibacter marinus]